MPNCTEAQEKQPAEATRPPTQEQQKPEPSDVKTEEKQKEASDPEPAPEKEKRKPAPPKPDTIIVAPSNIFDITSAAVSTLLSIAISDQSSAQALIASINTFCAPGPRAKGLMMGSSIPESR